VEGALLAVEHLLLGVEGFLAFVARELRFQLGQGLGNRDVCIHPWLSSGAVAAADWIAGR
jgi:hypothetical protein